MIILEASGQLLPLIAAFSLGLLAGALLTEDRLLVPYWRTLPADAFAELHPVVGPMLYRFFTPLTIAAPLAAVLSAVQFVMRDMPTLPTVTSLAAAVLAMSLVVIYFLFFKAANDAFAQGTVAASDLPDALARWATWHRLRVILCLLAFGFSIVAVAG